MIWLALAAWYLLLSLITATAFAIDKRRALRNAWRIPEARLHLLELLGGWPGALVAQHLFRHKRHKLSYQLVLVVIILLHAAAWAACFSFCHR